MCQDPTTSDSPKATEDSSLTADNLTTPETVPVRSGRAGDEGRVATTPCRGPAASPVTLPNGELGLWSLHIEFTFPVGPDEVTPKFEGDTESDFGERALDRLGPQLDALVGEGGPFVGYYVLPQRVYAPDEDGGGERNQLLRRVYA